LEAEIIVVDVVRSPAQLIKINALSLLQFYDEWHDIFSRKENLSCPMGPSPTPLNDYAIPFASKSTLEIFK